MELDGHLARPGDLEDRGSPSVSERDLGIGIVVGDREVPVAGPVDRLGEVFPAGDRPRWVVRVVEVEQVPALGEALPIREPPSFGVEREEGRAHSGEPNRVRIRRIARVRNHDAGAGVEDRPREGRDPLLRTDEDADLPGGVDLHAEPAIEPVGERLTKLRLAARRGVPVPPEACIASRAA